MWLNVLALLVLTVFAGLGAWRGGLATGLSIASLVIAYAMALYLAPALAPVLDARLGIGSFWALPAAGMGSFLAVYTALGLGTTVLRRDSAARNATRSPRDRFLGGSFGALRGAMIALLLAYLAMWLDAARASGLAPWFPELGEPVAVVVTSELVAAGVQAALGDGDATARVVGRLAARPTAAVGELQGLVDSPQLAALREDAMFWSYVEHGSVDTALNRGSFQRVAGDEALRRRMAGLGLVPPESEQDPAVFRAAVADVMHEVGPRIRGLKNDPEVKRLLEDPQVVAMLQSGDTFGLLLHPDVRALVDRVASQ